MGRPCNPWGRVPSLLSTFVAPQWLATGVFTRELGIRLLMTQGTSLRTLFKSHARPPIDICGTTVVRHRRPKEDLEIRLPVRVLLPTCVAPQWLATPSSRGNRGPFMRGTSPHPFLLHPGRMGGGCTKSSRFCLCRRCPSPSGVHGKEKTAAPPTKVLLRDGFVGPFTLGSHQTRKPQSGQEVQH